MGLIQIDLFTTLDPIVLGPGKKVFDGGVRRHVELGSRGHLGAVSST